jgi:ABC-type transporter Mla subunit MlaD
VITPGNARELLIIEALGDITKLLDRVEAVASGLEAASQAVLRASTDLQSLAAGLDARMAMLVEASKTHVAKHIAQRTDEMTRSAADQHNRAMEALAKALFETELRAALRQLGQFLDARIAQRNLREAFLTHLAVAAVVATATYGLMVYFPT